ncbi:hypothetical protein HYY75_00660 [bacterium]|nr:hypothetical protein [bacterium]
MRLKDEKKIYDGPLKDHLIPFIANQPYVGMPSQLGNVVAKSPMQEHFQGDLWYALPEEASTYLMDFYFIPRSTEDFFRGRKTITMGGNSFDRFVFKYINDARSYLSGVKGQTLEISGILALNDPDTLELNNLTFRGKGVIQTQIMTLLQSSPLSSPSKLIPRQMTPVTLKRI